MSKKWLMWGACGLMVLGGAYLLWARGNQNIVAIGMLLLCPLSHLLMMGGHDHSGHGHDGHDDTAEKTNGQSAQGKPACH